MKDFYRSVAHPLLWNFEASYENIRGQIVTNDKKLNKESLEKYSLILILKFVRKLLKKYIKKYREYTDNENHHARGML